MSEVANPYAPPKAAVEIVVEAPPIELASRAARLGASLVDAVAFGAAVLFGTIISPLGMVLCALALGGVNLWTLHRHRASIGKLALSLRIVRTDGSEAELWRIVFLRWLPTAAIGAFLAPLALVDVLFIFGAARRCVHDYIADTVVVDAR